MAGEVGGSTSTDGAGSKDGGGFGGEKDAGSGFSDALDNASAGFGDKPGAAPADGFETGGGPPKDGWDGGHISLDVPGYAPIDRPMPGLEAPDPGVTNTAGGPWDGPNISGWGAVPADAPAGFGPGPATPQSPAPDAGWDAGMAQLADLLGWSPPDTEEEPNGADEGWSLAALTAAVIRPWVPEDGLLLPVQARPPPRRPPPPGPPPMSPPPGIGHNRPPAETWITRPGAPPPTAPGPVVAPGGLIDRPPTSNEIGLRGELLARLDLQARGYTEVERIGNNSGHGIDLTARAPDGSRVFFEVKTTTADAIPALSRDQRRAEEYVRDRLDRAVNERGSWGSAPPGTSERARFLQREIASAPFTTRRIDVYLNRDLGLRRLEERDW